MSVCAIVPVKRYSLAKSRLSAVLSRSQRGLLAEWMVARVIQTIARTVEISQTLIVGDVDLPTRFGALDKLADPGFGQNAAILKAFAELESDSIHDVLVLSADLPLLHPHELSELVVKGRCAGMSIAPDRHGTGTNAIFLSIPTRMRPSFGIDSLSRHIKQGQTLGFRPALIKSPGLALDIDMPSDLKLLCQLRPEITSVLGLATAEMA